MLLPRASSPQHSPAGLRLWLRGDPRTSGSGRKTGRSRPGIWRGSLPSDRPKYPVPCLAWRVAHRAWPTQATHNGEVVVIGLCLVPIPGIQRHRVHSKQHFGRRITLCQLFGSATPACCGERAPPPHRAKALSQSQALSESSLASLMAPGPPSADSLKDRLILCWGAQSPVGDMCQHKSLGHRHQWFPRAHGARVQACQFPPSISRPSTPM